MFSSMVNHEKNLIYSERFSYDNYDFYNIYENLEEVYKDDLSKFIYHCNRRTRPTIAAYGNNKLFNRHSYERFISYSKHGRITMEDYINMFLDVFI